MFSSSLRRMRTTAWRASASARPSTAIARCVFVATNISSHSSVSASSSAGVAPFSTQNFRYQSKKRSQSTAATAHTARPAPSPAFNLTPPPVNPLNKANRDLDESFVGLSGGEIFHEMMLRQGVDVIFGYPGGAILPVFDAIYNSKHFDFVLPRHEQGAGHMAEGYARASGRPGVVLVTSGPGATNCITPMQDALSDGTPMVVFCGQVTTGAIGTDAFQEADVIGISRACTKWNVMVKDVAELPRRIKEAFEIATNGRPGPVLVDLPKDVTAGILRKAIPMSSSLATHLSPAMLAAKELNDVHLQRDLSKVAALIKKAKKPVLYVGQGILASPEGPKLLKELANRACIPVTTTLHALGAFDEEDPKALHMLGMHGSAYANLAMQEADLIIAMGARFDDRVTGAVSKFAPQAKVAAAEGRGGIVQFEVMPKNINKVVEADVAVQGDCAENIAGLLDHLETIPGRPEWFAQIDYWKKTFPFSLYGKESAVGAIKPQSVIAKLSELTNHMKDRTVITTGVGQHQMWAAQHFRWRFPRTMVTSGGLGTMGYGLPSAIGAKAARPDALVINIDGDGSFNMTLTEMSTAVQAKLGVKTLLLNNEELGMVTQWQNLFYEDRFAHTHIMNPNFVKLAEAMHTPARRITKPEEVEDALKWLIEEDGPALLEVMVEQKEPVLPMVPAGKGLHEFLIYDEEKDRERRALMKQRSGY